MFLSVLHFLNALMFLDISLAILCCILIIKLPAGYALKYVTIPIVLLITYMSIVALPNMLGRPYEAYPTEEFEFKDYRIVMDNDVKKIEIWVIENKKSRLYLIDYSEQKEQAMSKAKTAAQKGHKQKGKFGKKIGKEVIGGDENQVIIEDVPLQQILPPKDD